MAFEIDDAIVAKTTKCNVNFKCLSGDSACLCDVVDSDSFSLVKVNTKAEISCTYLFPSTNLLFAVAPQEMQSMVGIINETTEENSVF